MSCKWKYWVDDAQPLEKRGWYSTFPAQTQKMMNPHISNFVLFFLNLLCWDEAKIMCAEVSLKAISLRSLLLQLSTRRRRHQTPAACFCTRHLWGRESESIATINQRLEPVLCHFVSCYNYHTNLCVSKSSSRASVYLIIQHKMINDPSPKRNRLDSDEVPM